MAKSRRYLEISDAIKQRIQSLGPNSLLPTEQELAVGYSVSRGTVRRALGLLERSGQISRHRGRGSIVSTPKVTRNLAPVYPFEEDLQRQHIPFETRVLAYNTAMSPSEPVRQSLRLPQKATVAFFSLARVVDGQVICHDSRYFALNFGSGIDPLVFQHRSVSDILSNVLPMPLSEATWVTEILPAPPMVAEVLRITPGVLVVANTGTAYIADGTPVEFAEMYYRVDRVRFKFSNRYLHEQKANQK